MSERFWKMQAGQLQVCMKAALYAMTTFVALMQTQAWHKSTWTVTVQGNHAESTTCTCMHPTLSVDQAYVWAATWCLPQFGD